MLSIVNDCPSVECNILKSVWISDSFERFSPKIKEIFERTQCFFVNLLDIFAFSCTIYACSISSLKLSIRVSNIIFYLLCKIFETDLFLNITIRHL